MRAAPVAIGLITAVIVTLPGSARPAVTTPEKMTSSQCRAMADTIAPIIKQIDTLKETLDGLDTAVVEPRPSNLSREQMISFEQRSKRRSALIVLGQYSDLAWRRMQRLRNCEMGGVQAAPF